MLNDYFVSHRHVTCLRNGPFGDFLDSLAKDLRRLDYSHNYGQCTLRWTARFGAFAEAASYQLEQVDEELFQRFVEEVPGAGNPRMEALNAMRHVLRHLRCCGVIPVETGPKSRDSDDVLLDGYVRHLHSVRGLTPCTCEQYQRGARRLLTWFHQRYKERDLSALAGVDILEFITEHADLHPSKSWRNNLCSQTRAFLRYLNWEGIVVGDPIRAVPQLPTWRLSTIPRHLPWQRVRSLIDGIDTSTPSGLRAKAAILLMAALGLRNKEVRTLELSDIAWRSAEIRLTQTKTRKERVLPLPTEVGAALVDYILRGRPSHETPNVFLRHKAPLGPLTSSRGLSGIVRHQLIRAGIDAPSHGAYLLRHSLATRMVNEGASVKAIADVLGHASIDTTAIYTKVNATHLADVALPFPGGEA